jgi:hypothetical protein
MVEKMSAINDYLLKNKTFQKIKKFKKSDFHSKGFNNWFNRTYKAKHDIVAILERSEFKKRKFLKPAEFESLFRLMRKFSHNQSLSRLIYELNGLENFNDKLWDLYYGTDSLPYRINNFMKLQKVGQQTTSQFLVVFDWEKYPLSTYKMEETLALDTEFKNNIRKEVIKKYELSTPNDISRRTMNYLIHFSIYEGMKELLELENYYQINIILWRYIQKNSLNKESKKKIIQIDEEKTPGLIIFVSYATKDSKIFYIKDVCEELKKRPNIGDVKYWEEDSRDNIIKYMNDNLGRCDIFIIFCSPNALISVPVEKEWTAAESMNIPIIPIFIKKEHIPPLLKPRRGVEFNQFDINDTINKIYEMILKRRNKNKI